MPRSAFTMRLKPGCAAEYEARHAAIWPELVVEMKAAGIGDYSIFLDEGGTTLFAVRTIAPDNSVAALRDKAIMRKWWDHMGDLMETNGDGSPLAFPLREVFRLD